MDVSFFIPAQYHPDEARREAWKSGGVPSLAASGKEATAQAWIFQTCLELSRHGVQLQLTDTLPASGVVVALAGNLPPGLQAIRQRFVIDVVADGIPHPQAQRHICQNPVQAAALPDALFIPHWPQPGLIPRDPSRGTAFSSIRFFGDPGNLLAGISEPGFAEYLRESHGMDFCCMPPHRWHDYSETDCVLAVRGKGRFPHKPATKLSNAWLANVPFIGSPESAFLAQGRPGVDFLPACTREDAISALARLRNDSDLRVRLVNGGRARSSLVSRDSIAARWYDVLNDCAISAFPRWRSHHPAAIRLRTAWKSLRLKLAFSLLGTSRS